MSDMKIIIDTLVQGTHAVISIEELTKKIASKKPLTIKLGADPTAPNLHLGHAVVLRKMRQFQDMGHNVIFLIGDFTARIGDPTGKSKTRPPLSEETILENTKTYIEQVSRILDPKRITVRYNSEWLDKMTSREWIRLCSHVTVARIIEREDFAKRINEKQPVGMHELLYPLLQGHDSVALKADVELGGTDQTFNMLMGRNLQEQSGMRPQVVITMPLLIGTDGVMKMSKSLKNDIGLTESPEQVFGKIMSLSDDMMWHYYELLTNKNKTEIENMKKSFVDGSLHPMECKKNLACEILDSLWPVGSAQIGRDAFENTFEKRNFDSAIEVACVGKEFTTIVDFIVLLNHSFSRSEVRRLIDGGAIKINDEKVIDKNMFYKPAKNDKIKIGKQKRFKIV